MSKEKCIGIILGAVLLLGASVVCRAANDSQSASVYFGHIEAACAPAGGKTVKERCDELRNNLLALKQCDSIDKACAPGEAVLRQIFGATYRETLPDYIVYFDQSSADGRFRAQAPVLMWQNRNTPHLYGARTIYAIVLSEKKVCLGVQVTTDYKTEPNPLSAVFKVLGAATVTDQAQAKPTESKHAQFTWYPLSGDPKDTDMWFGIAGAGVDVNTVNRITVQYVQPKKPAPENKPPSGDKPASEKKSPAAPPSASENADPGDECTQSPSGPERYTGDFLAANGFFSNSPESYGTVSLALGGTFNVRGTSVASGGSNQYFNGYALAKFYLIRPELRAGPGTSGYRKSLGLVIGTNISHTPFDEIVFGVSLGHVIGNVGFVIGGNSTPARRIRPRAARHARSSQWTTRSRRARNASNRPRVSAVSPPHVA